MAPFDRFLAVASLALAVAAYSPAQTPEDVAQVPPSAPSSKVPSFKTIDAWLHSDDQRLVAWGAHDALVTRDRHFVSQLLTLASQWQPISTESDEERLKRISQEQKDQRDAMAAVVDALIQMNVSVPADTVRALAPDFGNAAAILLTRMPADDAEPLALDFYRTPSRCDHGLQYVSAVLLAQRPPEGFAADLLKSITVRAEVFVKLPGAPDFGTGSSGSYLAEQTVPRKDWPTTGQYRLSKEKSDKAVLVVSGVDPIYATREQATTYLSDVCRSLYLATNDRHRLIASMLDISPDSMPWQTQMQTTIEFVSKEQFDFALRRFIDDLEEKYRTTAYALAARSLISAAEVGQALPKMQLVISDMRGTGQNPIVELANLPPNVEWQSSPWK
jgi:hypothetical protein